MSDVWLGRACTTNPDLIAPLRRPTGRHRRAATVVSSVGLVSLSLAACSSAKGATSSATRASAPPTTSVPPTKGSGPVNVLYAGSLVDLLEKQIGPAFNTASGYSFTGFAGGSTALAFQIKAKVHRGDVFISASPKVNTSLEGVANGNWVSWYATFANSPLVIGYSSKSKFAEDLETKPWYQVVGEPGFLLGRTDPATDPKGALALTALKSAATTDNEPALARQGSTTGNVFPEETLVGRLQAGQLDAGFFYSSEAVAAHIPTVPLIGEDLKATYTITVLDQAPDEAGAEAFVGFLLGPEGQTVLKSDGFDVVTPPVVAGVASAVPASIENVITGR